MNNINKEKTRKRSDEKGRAKNVVTNNLKLVPVESICSTCNLI
jgi:hypothetical protein